MISRNDILSRLKARDRSAIELVYKCLFPSIYGWVSLNSGTREDAEDVFHDSLLSLIIKLDMDKVQLTCDFSTYFISICRNKWFQILYKRKRQTQISCENCRAFSYDMHEMAEEEEIANNRYCAFIEALHDLDSRSQAVMEASLNGKSNEEIAMEMGFINSQAVADKKKNCKKKLIRILAGDKANIHKVNGILKLHRAYCK